MNTDQKSLHEIGTEFGSDKFTVHDFAPVYDRYFAPMREQPIKLLEIGIGGEGQELGGPSLKTWEAYFPNAQIFGIDIFDKSELDSGRIKTFVCDQSDQEKLLKLSEEFGPFDIVIDDGCHEAEPTLRSMFALFPKLNTGGYYVIEDIQTSYWPHYGGTSVLGDISNTPVFWLKRIIDVINSPEILWSDHPAKRSGFAVDELHVHHNIAFVRRGGVSAKSSVLNESLMDEWFRRDLEKQDITEEFAMKYNGDPEFRLKLATLLSKLRD